MMDLQLGSSIMFANLNNQALKKVIVMPNDSMHRKEIGASEELYGTTRIAQ
jgi:hypothetical protein